MFFTGRKLKKLAMRQNKTKVIIISYFQIIKMIVVVESKHFCQSILLR